jgi:hypothetical protein
MKFNRSKPLLAITNQSRLVTDEEIASYIPALQRQITEHFEPAWGIGAQLVFAKRKPPRNAYQIIVMDEAKEAGYIGYHFHENGYPVANIFAKEDLSDDRTVSDTLSHEILEMIVDPAVNLYAYRPAGRGRRERGYFYEVCDPVQCVHYKIDGVKVINFVYPEWYEYVWPKGSRKFDHLGKLSEPFEILAGCYADVREAGVGWKTIWGSKPKARKQRRVFTRVGNDQKNEIPKSR